MPTTTSSVKNWQSWVFQNHDLIVASLAMIGIGVHLGLRYGSGLSATIYNVPVVDLPLFVVLIGGGIPVLLELSWTLLRRELGADILAGISIIASLLLGEYLAGAFVVLMLSGGEAIEAYAIASASSVLSALAKRMPTLAHRQQNGSVLDCRLDDVAVSDVLIVFPHEICPVDGVVIAGHGTMDESFLTGEPYNISKTPGSEVISGALNGETAITIRATRRSADSRYAQIMKVMEQSEQYRPRLQRLGDQLGAWYTPLALGLAMLAWLTSGEAIRFLAVLVVATPCPLLIAIPVAIIGAISLSARQGIIVKKPIVLEQIGECRTIIFDKTGTLTYGRPALTEELIAPPWQAREVLQFVASVERYSKHPLAVAILDRARQAGVSLLAVDEISEKPGQGLTGKLAGHAINITSRQKLETHAPQLLPQLPPPAAGLECLVLIDGNYAATYRFRDEPRDDGKPFIQHLRPKHAINRVLIVSGDRESEVRYLAEKVGIHEVFAGQSPEQKLTILQAEMAKQKTIFVGDGINDAPALNTATVGIAFGQASDITSEAAGAVIMDSSLLKVDQFLHIGQRMRSIALQSAVGGMALSVIGMVLAANGWLPPVAGALFQEVIDVLAVLNAVRVAWSPEKLSDFRES
jgi:heavy metal translocating P-type ATPase